MDNSRTHGEKRVSDNSHPERISGKDEDLDDEKANRDIFLKLNNQTKIALSITDGKRISPRLMSAVLSGEKIYSNRDGISQIQRYQKNKNVALRVSNIRIGGIVIDCFSFYHERAKK